jgi:hypothetical protein
MGRGKTHSERAERRASCHLNVSSELRPFQTDVLPATPIVKNPRFSSRPSDASRSAITSSAGALPLLRVITILFGMSVYKGLGMMVVVHASCSAKGQSITCIQLSV